MPNGRSGGFVIETADLKQLVQAISGETVVGKLFTMVLKEQPACAEEVLRLIDECRKDRLAVEEQDHAFYVIHFSDERNIKWLLLNSTSPMFAELRSRHARWLDEHSG
jgi:hypothetical protein